MIASNKLYANNEVATSPDGTLVHIKVYTGFDQQNYYNIYQNLYVNSLEQQNFMTARIEGLVKASFD